MLKIHFIPRKVWRVCRGDKPSAQASAQASGQGVGTGVWSRRRHRRLVKASGRLFEKYTVGGIRPGFNRGKF
jgi:hypothetical protein